MCNQQSLRSACAYAQSDQRLCLSFDYSTNVKLLTEHHFKFLSLTGGCTGWSEDTLVKMPHCWKSHVTAQMALIVAAFISDIISICPRNISNGYVNGECNVSIGISTY